MHIKNTKNKTSVQNSKNNYVLVEKFTNLLSTSQNVSPKIKNYGSVQNKNIIQGLYGNESKKLHFQTNAWEKSLGI